MNCEASDLHMQWNQLPSAICALLEHRGILVNWKEVERSDGGLRVRTNVIAIDISAVPGDLSTVDMSVRYMHQVAEGASILANDGVSMYRRLNELLDQCEAGAADNDQQRADQERLVDDGGRPVAGR